MNLFKRLDKQTCAKEGILFDGTDSPPEENLVDQDAEGTGPEDIVSGILDQLLFETIDDTSSMKKGEVMVCWSQCCHSLVTHN
jgi:hypothetical protein